MISFWRIFWLEFTGFVRSKALALLIAASVLWMFGLPFVMRSDGTAAGGRELYVRFSLGGVFALLVIALLASAAGSLAHEREAKRLQLTLVRPVRYALIVLGKILAHVTIGALVLAVACGALAFKVDSGRPCSHVLSPILPSPREEAKRMYELYMKDPGTPEPVKRAKKETVLRLLANRAADRYETVRTNACETWGFEDWESSGRSGDPGGLAVRMRFTNQYEMRQEIRGTFSLGGYRGGVSNVTQAVVTVPLTLRDAGATSRASRTLLSFVNRGKSALMLRPRKDIHLLVPADAFGWNLLRAYAVLVAVLTLLVSFGVFLSAGLGRPVALFVAFVALAIGEMSPSVTEEYPDELEMKFADRVGLRITRFVTEMMRPVSSVAPLEALAKDECVEPATVGRVVLLDLGVLPVLVSALAALILSRKPDDDRT